MRRNYNEWMVETIKELTPTGKFKRPSYETVANWVKDSWSAVDVNLIRRSFKCCGVSNKRNGIEDNWIFNYDRLGQANKLNDEVEIPLDREDEDYEYEEDEDENYEYEEDKDDEDEEEYEEDEDGCEEEEDGYDEEFNSYYEQRTNYVNVWDD